jgi:hypothetical protein
MKQLLFVHGRAQQHKDALALKREWIAALHEGLEKNGLALPISEDAIRFPYYGQTLFDLVSGVAPDRVTEVILKGANADHDERAFMREVIQEVKQKANVSDQMVADVAGREVIVKGWQDWEWLRAVLRTIDCTVPGASGASIALVTHDVYQYLSNIGIRDDIEVGVRQAMQPDIPTVVVGHSLGTVVSYSLLRREGQANRWTVPLYVTLGAPLAVTAIKRGLAPNKHPACVGQWFNALDERDVVALYPLDREHFPVSPEIKNKTNVRNETENRHGIAGYLNDKEVAQRIYDALIA